MPTVVLLGTLDTKGPEYTFVRDRIREFGLAKPKLVREKKLAATLPEDLLAAIEAELSDAAAWSDGGGKAAELGRRQAQLREQLEAAEASLLSLYEADAA